MYNLEDVVFITHAVADPFVFHDVFAVQNAQGFDLLLEVLQGRLLAGLQLLHSDQLARVVTQRIVTVKFHAPEIPLRRILDQDTRGITEL